MVVHNTVVRATMKVNGKHPILGPPPAL